MGHYLRFSMLFIVAIVSVMACKKVESEPPKLRIGITVDNVTYTNYIKKALTNRCNRCHGPGANAGYIWVNAGTYEDALKYGVALRNQIVWGLMPTAAPMDEPDRRLFDAWFNRGMPKN